MIATEPIRFIETPNVDGGTTLHKVEYNVGLTDYELQCLMLIINQWSDAVALADDPRMTVALRNRLPNAAKRIQRELERALDRPMTHFE